MCVENGHKTGSSFSVFCKTNLPFNFGFLFRYRPLVQQNICPNVIFGYGVWMCDSILEETNLFHQKLDCDHLDDGDKKRASLDEKIKMCSAIKDIKSNRSSSSMQILMQEEVDISLKEMSDIVFTHYDEAQRVEIWRSFLFQLAYTFHVLQQYIPGFRHNDLSWSNVRSTAPSTLNVNRTSKGRT